MMRYRVKIVKLAVNGLLKFTGEKLTVTRTVDELLFKGYNDRLLSIASKLEKFNITVLPYDKFGWFYQVSKFVHLTLNIIVCVITGQML